jgi:serine/threonine protein kinase SCH9
MQPERSPNLRTSIISSKLSHFSSVFISKAMIKFWPSTPVDQLTPRGGTVDERNPFDLPQFTSSRRSSSSPAWPTTPTSTSYHPLLSSASHLYSPSMTSHSANADVTTPPLGTPTFGVLPAALPTTQLSLHAPDFNMQQPPSASRRALRNNPSAPSPSSSSHSATSTPQVTSSKGQIHVKLIQARGLNVRSSSARPYVVAEFEQNEFISRDPTDETDKEVKGTPVNPSRTNSSNAISALGAIGSKAITADRGSANASPSSSVSSSSSKSTSGLSNGLFGRLSAHNPVWKHEVSL